MLFSFLALPQVTSEIYYYNDTISSPDINTKPNTSYSTVMMLQRHEPTPVLTDNNIAYSVLPSTQNNCSTCNCFMLH